MRIALILERFDPAGGGAERSAWQIGQELVQRGHELTVLAGSAEHADLPGWHVLACRDDKLGSGLGRIRFRRWCADQLAPGSFDVSLSLTTGVPADLVQPRAGLISEALARNVARRPSMLSRLIKRASIALSPRYRLLLRLERLTMIDPAVKRFVAISQYMARQMRRDYGVAEDRIAVIPNAAKVPELSPEERQARRERQRAALGLSGSGVPRLACPAVAPQAGDDCTVYLFAALDPFRKGFEPLLQAGAILRQQGDRFLLYLVGFDSPQARRAVQRHGLADVTHFAGRLPDLTDAYCAADVTVLPTWYDPASKVVIESLMMGVPAVTTIYNGAGDWLEGEQGHQRGRLIKDPRDASALAQTMREAASPEVRAACEAGAAALRPHLSMATHVERLEKLMAEASGG